jgi:hypothetical protein
MKISGAIRSMVVPMPAAIERRHVGFGAEPASTAAQYAASIPASAAASSIERPHFSRQLLMQAPNTLDIDSLRIAAKSVWLFLSTAVPGGDCLAELCKVPSVD